MNKGKRFGETTLEKDQREPDSDSAEIQPTYYVCAGDCQASRMHELVCVAIDAKPDDEFRAYLSLASPTVCLGRCIFLSIRSLARRSTVRGSAYYRRLQNFPLSFRLFLELLRGKLF